MMVRLNRPVTFLLPFNPYTLKVSHRLLDSMGGVSRFILRALGQGLTLDQIVEVTGLSQSTLLHQLSFLEQHYFLKSDHSVEPHPVTTLTERGRRMIDVERRLEGFAQAIWIDGFTLKRHEAHLLVTTSLTDLTALSATATAADEDAVVTLPQRSKAFRAFDEVNRLRNVLSQDALARLLEHCWTDASQLIADEIDHFECSLLRPVDMEPVHLPVTFAPGELVLRMQGEGLAKKDASLPTLALPVIRLQQTFRRAEGFPWPVSAPPASAYCVELASHTKIAEISLAATIDAAAVDHVVIPAVTGDTLPESIEAILAPPGLAVEVSVTRHHLPCALDHHDLSQKMHQQEGVLVFSTNFKPEAMAA